MQNPVEITFRGMSSSPSLESTIEHWVARLEHKYDRIHSCSVVVELPHQHHRHGNQFHVRIDLSVPGRQISVSRDPEREGGHEDVYVAVADAFHSAQRQLQDYASIRRNEVKNHE